MKTNNISLPDNTQQSQLLDMQISVSLSDYFHNKTNTAEPRHYYNKAKDEHGNIKGLGWWTDYAFVSFKTTAATVRRLIQHLLDGRAIAIAAYKDDHRSKKNFLSCQLLWLDFDDGVSVAQIAAHPFFARYGFFAYATPSSTPERPKTRAGFLLSTPITSAAKWEAMQRGLLALFADLKPDANCKDAARPYYGSAGAEHIILDNVLPVEIAGALTFDEAQAEQRRRDLPPRVPVDLTDQHTRNRAERYAQKTLTRILDTMAGAHDGERHAAYKKSAALVASMIKGGWQGIDRAEQDLKRVAASTGLSEDYIERFWSWAWQNVEARPLDLPDDTRRIDGTQHAQETATSGDQGARSWFAGHLPNHWRSALLTLDAAAAPVVELIDRAAESGDIALAGFTLGDLLACQSKYGFALAKETLKRGVLSAKTILCIRESAIADSSGENGFSTLYSFPLHRNSAAAALLDALERHYQLHTFTPDDFAGFDDFTSDYEILSDRLNDDLEAERALAADEAVNRRAWWSKRLAWHKSTPLPGWTLTNARTYRAAWLHAMIAEQPERRRNYKQIAALLGISVKSVKPYLDLAGARNDVQVERVTVTSAAAVKEAQYQHKARVCNYEAVYPDGQVAKSYYADDADFVEQHARAGAVVTVELQGASKQTIIRDTPPEVPARRQRAVVEPSSAPPASAPATTPRKAANRQHEGYLRAQFNRALRLCGTPARARHWILPTGELIEKRADSHILLRALLCVLDDRNEKRRPAAATSMR